ncbi:MoaD/ThiS family protein [Helicobacter sp. MIT 05-5293]|uniref:MoaD/ThiS family protein n=1 Tax=Helicobacter sp. MIT 05-5293 TaxID=1548149 RepID=UPI00051E0AAA|nr:MoaD/ThiS family protein [Helicobacter sp. MIT 05-5293]TLD80497.1 MoaD/ThiS family protein [Helicobacter sp. MIT 05-5293]
MIRVEFLGPMSDLPPKEINAQTLQDLKNELLRDEKIQKWLPISAVAINDEIIEDLSYPLKSGDKVLILPPVCGG